MTKAGRYELVEELGRGAMGIVYRAHDPVIGRTVAVKTVRLVEAGTGMNREDLVARFKTEARAAGQLAHPNIVVVHDAGEEGGLFYITMELVEGRGEDLRLLYVALTRAQHQTVLWWAGAMDSQHSPLARLMFERDEHGVVRPHGSGKRTDDDVEAAFAALGPRVSVERVLRPADARWQVDPGEPPRLEAAVNNERIRLGIQIAPAAAARLRSTRTIPHNDGIATLTAELDENSAVRLLAASDSPDDQGQACRRAADLATGIDGQRRPLAALQAELLLIETLTATGRVAEARAGALHVSARCAEVGLPRLLVDAGLS